MSEINVSSQYRLLASYPLDAHLTPVNEVSGLYAIPSSQRYVGMTVTVKNDPAGKQTDYWLVGGINNANWVKKASDSLEIAKLAAPSTSAYSESYQLQVNGSTAALGAIINIPKDYRVIESTASTVSAADKSAGGKFSASTDFFEGDRYADFVINTKSKDGEVSHVYLNCQPIINDLYLEDSGITIASGVSSSTISIKIDENSQSFLTVGVDGLKLSDVKADHIELGTHIVDQYGAEVYAESAMTQEVLQDMYLKLEGKGLSAVTSTGKSITIKTLNSVSNLEVSKERNTQDTRNEGHIELLQNNKGELYGILYYLCGDSTQEFIDAITSTTETAVTLGDSTTIDTTLTISTPKILTITDDATLELKEGLNAAANSTIVVNGLIEPSTSSTNEYVIQTSGITTMLTIDGTGTIISAGKTNVAPIVLNCDGDATIKNGTIIGSVERGCVLITQHEGSVYSAQTNSQLFISGGTFKLYGWDEAPSYSAIPTTQKETLIKVKGLGYKWSRDYTTGAYFYHVISLIDVANTLSTQVESIVKVCGGTFYGRDPKLGDEIKGGTYIADGYKSVERVSEPGVFDVVPK